MILVYQVEELQPQVIGRNVYFMTVGYWQVEAGVKAELDWEYELHPPSVQILRAR